MEERNYWSEEQRREEALSESPIARIALDNHLDTDEWTTSLAEELNSFRVHFPDSLRSEWKLSETALINDGVKNKVFNLSDDVSRHYSVTTIMAIAYQSPHAPALVPCIKETMESRKIISPPENRRYFIRPVTSFDRNTTEFIERVLKEGRRFRAMADREEAQEVYIDVDDLPLLFREAVREALRKTH